MRKPTSSWPYAKSRKIPFSKCGRAEITKRWTRKQSPSHSFVATWIPMAKCEQGYLCDVCGADVEAMTDSDLYLRYIVREVRAEELHVSRERHIRCNPVLAHFIVDSNF